MLALKSVRPYLVAVLATALMVPARIALTGALADGTPTLFLVAVLAVAWYGGLNPGLLATALSVVYEVWLFPPSEFELGTAPGTAPRLGLLAALGVFVSWLGGTMHRHQRLALHVQGVAERVHAERTVAESAMRVSEIRYRRLFESSKDGILILDTDTAAITDANPYICQILGYTRDELHGRELWEIGLFKDKEANKAAMEELQANGYIRYEDLPLATRVGAHIDVEFVSNVYVEDGQSVIQCNIRDITERKRLRDIEQGSTSTLRQYAADLTVSDRRKTEFLAILAHELRNPLAPIRNALQVMRLTPGNADVVHASTTMMERQVDQLVRLVDDLLDVSRISRGRIDLRRDRIDLCAAIRHAVEAADELVQCQLVEVTVHLPPQPVFVHADPTRLAQIIGNLLNNACKYTDPGGKIDLTLSQDDAQAVLRVQDSGIGIDADHLPRLFDMFMQADSSLERSSGGLGIGLTLVRSLVEMHSGSVTVTSAGVGKGSEFIVRLPIMTGASGALPDVGTHPLTITNARRILVVDDNVDAATSLAELLNLTGHETRTAFDGAAAVAEAERFRPDVILLDIGLPGLSGYEVCRRIREQVWGRSIAIVALTGWGQDEDRKRSLDAGFDGHMVKPVDFSELAVLLGDRAAEEFAS